MSQPLDPKGAGASRGGATSTSAPESGLERLRNLFGGGKPPGPPRSPSDGEDEEDEGMLRMSFLEHLEELRTRIIRILIGIGVALGVSLTFCDPLWRFVVQPAKVALIANGFPPTLAQLSPMEAFNVIWFKLPVV